MAHKVLNLDLSKEPRGNPIVYGRVGDSDSQMVTVNVTKKLSKQDFSDYTISFEGETSGGKAKVIDSENVISTPEGLKQGTFDYLFPSKAFAVAGEYKRAYFSFVNGDSRDTTGDFEFVVLQNADLTAEEAETVILEYNKLVEELQKQQDLAIDEMDQNFAVAQERIVELENQISDLRSQIEQALADFETGNFWTKEESFNKEQSSANVIYQVIGKEKVRIPIEADLNKKVAGSILENGNIASCRAGATLYKPNEFSADSDINYSNLAALDNNIQRLSNSTTGNRSQMFVQYDLIDIVTRKLGSSFWTNQGADTLQKKVSILKKITCSNVDSRVWGFGDSPSGNSLKCANWVLSSSWQPQAPSMQNKITKITATNSIGAGITDDGKWNTIAYAEVSDGASSSSLSIDYAQLEFTIEISVNEFILSTIAQNHVENIGNVDNYGTATQAEAEAGSASDKFMTPLGTKQYVSSRVATQTETEGGTSSEKLMTPLRTKQHVDSRMATQEEAEAGSSETAIMTPLSVKQHFDFNLPDSLKSLLKLQSGTLTITGGNTGTLNWVRIGDLVFCMVNSLNGRGGGGLDSSIGSMPFKAKRYLEFLLTSDDRSALNSAQLSINTDGAIRWKRSSGIGSNYHGMFFYEIQE